jgi:hypothetical protein
MKGLLEYTEVNILHTRLISWILFQDFELTPRFSFNFSVLAECVCTITVYLHINFHVRDTLSVITREVKYVEGFRMRDIFLPVLLDRPNRI